MSAFGWRLTPHSRGLYSDDGLAFQAVRGSGIDRHPIPVESHDPVRTLVHPVAEVHVDRPVDEPVGKAVPGQRGVLHQLAPVGVDRDLLLGQHPLEAVATVDVGVVAVAEAHRTWSRPLAATPDLELLRASALAAAVLEPGQL